jgi:hypothetical protein
MAARSRGAVAARGHGIAPARVASGTSGGSRRWLIAVGAGLVVLVFRVVIAWPASDCRAWPRRRSLCRQASGEAGEQLMC